MALKVSYSSSSQISNCTYGYLVHSSSPELANPETAFVSIIIRLENIKYYRSHVILFLSFIAKKHSNRNHLKQDSVSDSSDFLWIRSLNQWANAIRLPFF